MAAARDRVSFFRTRLEDLGCPYIEGVDDSWIEELLYKPGEPRMRLLQWLLGRFDPTVHDILEGQQMKMKNRNDSRLQRLLFSAHLLGLCRSDDIALVKGETSRSKQTAFFENLVGLVSTVDSADTLARRHGIPVASSLADQFENDCKLLDLLCRQEDLSSVFKTRIQLCPPDLDKGNSRQDDKRPPDNKHLASVADNLAIELDTQNRQLEQIREKVPSCDADPQTMDKVSKTLGLVLTTLSQELAGFLHCYESEMKPWCRRNQPVLSELGPAFKRVHTLLRKFINLLESLGVVRTSHDSICRETKSKLEQVKATSFAPVTTGFLNSLEECVNVLEESLERYQETGRLD